MGLGITRRRAVTFKLVHLKRRLKNGHISYDYPSSTDRRDSLVGNTCSKWNTKPGGSREEAAVSRPPESVPRLRQGFSREHRQDGGNAVPGEGVVIEPDGREFAVYVPSFLRGRRPRPERIYMSQVPGHRSGSNTLLPLP